MFGKHQIITDMLHILRKPLFDLHGIFAVRQFYFFISRHTPQVIVIGEPHISIIEAVNTVVFQEIVNLSRIRAAVRVLVHRPPVRQMRQHPGVYLIVPIGVDTIGKYFQRLYFFFQKRYLPLKGIPGIGL